MPRFFRISKYLFPNFAHAWLKEAILEAHMGAGQIAMGCKIYKIQEGHFPENIAALIPDILEKEPIDPFTGDPFIYKLQEDGFVVYSVGSNEKDDDWSWREKNK